jgi:glycosyltransferase XagB
MQTWLVHMRHPRRLVRDLTPAGAIALQLFLTCNVFAALIHPFFIGALGYCLLSQPPLQAVAAMGPDAAVFVATFLGGYASTIALDLIGLQRRGLLAHAWVLTLTPLYWLMLSLAAWRALYQLVCDPQGWEKTEHGLAKNSRIAGSNPRKSFNSHSPIAPKRIMEMAAGSRIATGYNRFSLDPARIRRANVRTRAPQR